MIERGLERLAQIEEKRSLAVIGVFLIITIVFAGGFFFISSDTSFENFIPDNTPVIKSLNEIRDNLNTGTNSIILIVQVDQTDPYGVHDIRDISIVKALEKILIEVEANEFVDSTQSVLPAVKKGGIFLSQQRINEQLRNSTMVSDDRSVMTAHIIIPDGLSTEQQNDIIAEIQHIVDGTPTPQGMTVTLAGSLVQEQEIQKSLGSNIGFVTMLGFVGVFIILYLTFRKISIVGIAVIPIVIGTMWTNGMLGYIGIPLSTALVGVFSMIIGVGIDFAIHIIHRFEEEVKKEPLEAAVAHAVKNVGKGLLLTTTTTVIGFMALLSATLPVLKDMAIALSFGVTFSFIAAIGLIPPLMVMLYNRRKSVSKHVKRDAQEQEKQREEKKGDNSNSKKQFPGSSEMETREHVREKTTNKSQDSKFRERPESKGSGKASKNTQDAVIQ